MPNRGMTLKTIKIGTAGPNTRNGARLRSLSLIMAPVITILVKFSTDHREHTVLLSRKRANIGMNRMNTLPWRTLPSLVISYSTL